MKRYVHVAFEDSSTAWYIDESNSLEVGRFVIVENRGKFVPAEIFQIENRDDPPISIKKISE